MFSVLEVLFWWFVSGGGAQNNKEAAAFVSRRGYKQQHRFVSGCEKTLLSVPRVNPPLCDPSKLLSKLTI